jgi:hypothetical protein
MNVILFLFQSLIDCSAEKTSATHSPGRTAIVIDGREAEKKVNKHLPLQNLMKNIHSSTRTRIASKE